MPRYFFHIHDTTEIVDEVGTVCADRDDARTQAVRAAGEMLKDLGGEFWNSEEWRMRVMDENGQPVCVLRFSAERT